MSGHHARLGATVLLVATLAGCHSPPPERSPFVADARLLHAAVHALTDVMLQSVTSPPVAARTYAYASVAAYEVLVHEHPEYRSFAGQLNGLAAAPSPEPAAGEHLLALSAVVAFLETARAIVFEPDSIVAHRDAVVEAARSGGASAEAVRRSVAYGEAVAQHVLAWSAGDGLREARALPRYVVRGEPGRWVPTAPAYIAAVEPNWQVLRPFTMDSAGQFRPPPPVPYDMTEGSPFHREVMAVYDAGRNLDAEQREIADFWDCNPYALRIEGHFMYADKKVTPGGHWMGITEIALRRTDADLMRAAEAYARVAIALADGFLSSWEEKYRSNLVRPETIINEKIDPDWRPLLQTPPFPEYTSGHSVISAAAAEVLTSLFGDGFAFDDTTEQRFGLPVRSFGSFREAAEEAAISRLYGGIHYPMAIDHGIEQGRGLAHHALERVDTRAGGLAAGN